MFFLSTVAPEIRLAGGTWLENNATLTDAHIDGNLVTAPAWPAHPEWIRKILQILGSTVEA